MRHCVARDNRPMRLAHVPLILLPLLAACAPALDWRELREPDTQLSAQFPCKPQRVAEAQMGLLQCEAGGQRFVLGWRRFADPAALQAELAAQAPKLAERLGARAEPLDGALPSAALAWPGSGRYRLQGGQQAVWAQVWAQGLTLHQAVVSGAGQDTVARQFFDGLRSSAP